MCGLTNEMLLTRDPKTVPTHVASQQEVVLQQGLDFGISPQPGALRMLHECLSTGFHLLFKQLAAKTDEKTTSANSTDVFFWIHGTCV